MTHATPYRILLPVILFAVLLGMMPRPARAIDSQHVMAADASIERGIAYLRSTQGEDGSWSPDPGPAVTALAVSVMLDQPDIDETDPAVAKGIAYILSKVQEDGGIHSGFLENYNTSIALSALSKVENNPRAAEAVAKAQNYLRGLQWNGQKDPAGETIDEGHRWYGGAGYGEHGRPDMSNTQMMIQGLHDSGMDCNDPVFLRAMTFIERCQGIESNDLLGDKIVQDGGLIYAPSLDKDRIDSPESKASPDMIDEAKAGRPVSGLRTYGSMTYAGFKSYLYAQLDRDDPRVQAAYGWIREHYTLDVNPGMPENMNHQGLYYYYMTMGRALQAWKSTTIQTPDGQAHDWANDLITKLSELQREDGSWVNEADRWMEGDPNLVTCYALTALQAARR